MEWMFAAEVGVGSVWDSMGFVPGVEGWGWKAGGGEEEGGEEEGGGAGDWWMGERDDRGGWLGQGGSG